MDPIFLRAIPGSSHEFVGEVADLDSKSHRVKVIFPHEAVDAHRTTFGPDAFRESFAEAKPPMVWQHDMRDPIGRAESAQVLADYNELISRFSDLDVVPSARRAFSQLEDGTLTDFSFGYSQGFERPHPDPQLRRMGVRQIPKAKMREHSPVTIGSIPGAKMVGLREDGSTAPALAPIEDPATIASLVEAKVLTPIQGQALLADLFPGLREVLGVVDLGDLDVEGQRDWKEWDAERAGQFDQRHDHLKAHLTSHSHLRAYENGRQSVSHTMADRFGGAMAEREMNDHLDHAERDFHDYEDRPTESMAYKLGQAKGLRDRMEDSGIRPAIPHAGGGSGRRIPTPHGRMDAWGDAREIAYDPPEGTRDWAKWRLEHPEEDKGRTPTGHPFIDLDEHGKSTYKPGMGRVGEPSPQSDPHLFSDEAIKKEIKHLIGTNKRHGSHPLRTAAYLKLMQHLEDRHGVEAHGSRSETYAMDALTADDVLEVIEEADPAMGALLRTRATLVIAPPGVEVSYRSVEPFQFSGEEDQGLWTGDPEVEHRPTDFPVSRISRLSQSGLRELNDAVGTGDSAFDHREEIAKHLETPVASDGQRGAPSESAIEFAQMVGTALDTCGEYLSGVDVRSLPDPVQQVVALVQAASVANDGLLEEMGVEAVGERADMTFSDKPWSDFSQADYTPQQWADSCLIDTGEGDDDTKDRYKLPVKEPDGTYNAHAISAAASRINQVEGVSDDKVKAAAKTLMSLHGKMRKSTPPKVLAIASGTRADDETAALSSAEAEALALLDTRIGARA